MNRLSGSPTVNVQISAPDGRLDATLAGRLAAAVVGALNAPEPPPAQAPAGTSLPSRIPAETAA